MRNRQDNDSNGSDDPDQRIHDLPLGKEMELGVSRTQ